MKLKAITFALLTVGATSTAFAGTHSMNPDCNVDIDMGINISPNSIIFSDHDKNKVSIEGNSLYIEGKEITLTSSQQDLLNRYAAEIRGIVPEVGELALEGIDMASEGVGKALAELLGDDSEAYVELTDTLDELRELVAKKFEDSENFVFKENMNADEFFGQHFESELQEAIERAIEKSMGQILVAVGKEMIFNSDNGRAFERKMEKFGRQVEHEMESRVEELEQKANGLCTNLVSISNLEDDLQQEIPELKEFDFISAENKKDI